MVVWKRRMFHTDRGTDPDFNARATAPPKAGHTQTPINETPKPPHVEPPCLETLLDQQMEAAMAAPSATLGNAHRPSSRRLHLKPLSNNTAETAQSTMAG